MPLPDPLLEPRYQDLIAELRDARIVTPAHVTVRVAELAAEAPGATRTRRRRRPLRIALGLASAAAIGLVGALFVAEREDATRRVVAAPAASTAGAAATTTATPATTTIAREALAVTGDDARLKSPTYATTAAGDSRAQHENAQLEIAVPSVEALSRATATVTVATESYGGYVVSADFARPTGDRGRSVLELKVPTGHMQEAIARFSGLGAIVSQHVDITDLQVHLDTLEQQIARLELAIARFGAKLAVPGLSAEQAATLKYRRAQASKRLADVRAGRSRTLQSARMADLEVALVTGAATDAATKAVDEGGASAAPSKAIGLLGRLGRWALFGAIVTAPFAVVAALVLWLRRILTVRRSRRVLEDA